MNMKFTVFHITLSEYIIFNVLFHKCAVCVNCTVFKVLISSYLTAQQRCA